MRPFYVLLLAGTQPTPSTGFLSTSSAFVSPAVSDASQRFRPEPTCRNLRNHGFRRGQLRAPRRTSSSSTSGSLSVASSSCRSLRARIHRPSMPRRRTRSGEVTNGSLGGRGGGASASRVSAVCASHMPTAGHARALTSEDSIPIAAGNSGVPSARIADPTAVAHEYLRDFLGMTEEELAKLSANYRNLPPGRRGPDEITVAGPELAAAAAKAAEAAAALVVTAAATTVRTAAHGASAAVSSSSGAAEGNSGVGGRNVGAAELQQSTEAMTAMSVVGEEDALGREVAAAASAAAGAVLIPEVPGIASVLHMELAVSKERVKRLVLRWPRLIEVSGYNVGQRVHWLIETLGLTREQVAKLVLAHPPILIKSIRRQLEPNLNWLEDDMGLARSEVRKIVHACPQLLVKSVSTNFLPKIEFFVQDIGINIAQVKVMLLRYPQLFNFSLENMAWKARYLTEEILLTPEQLKSVIGRCPAVFAYSIESNLVPTVTFFVKGLGATRTQIRDAVVKQPRLLGMSLERRLVPRWQELHKAGVTPSWHVHHQIMLFAGDSVFLTWLENETSGRHIVEGVRGPTKQGRAR